jgi:hypothetical protein
VFDEAMGSSSDLPWSRFTVRQAQDGNGIPVLVADVVFSGTRPGSSIALAKPGQTITIAVQPSTPQAPVESVIIHGGSETVAEIGKP